MNSILGGSQRYLATFVFSLSILGTSYSANAFEVIHNMSHIQKEAKSGDWVFLDIDDTILRAKFESMNPGSDDDDGIRTVELVDKQTSTIIKELQHKGISVFALTARSYSDEGGANDFSTYKDLKDVGVTMSFFSEVRQYVRNTTSPTHRRHHSSSERSGFYLGTIFANHSAKGEALGFYLKTLKDKGYPLPNRILFADDLEENIRSVESYAPTFGIGEVKCFHFKPKQGLPELVWMYI